MRTRSARPPVITQSRSPILLSAARGRPSPSTRSTEMSSGRSLEVVGPFKGSSGYDRHTREFVREFIRQGVSVKLPPLPGWSIDLPPELRETWFDSLDAPVSADTLLHFTMPNQAQPRSGKRNVNYTMFEAEKIPQLWAACAS